MERKTMRISVFVAVMVILSAGTVFAYKNMDFQNLNHLLHHTDLIVLAELTDKKPVKTEHGGTVYEMAFVRNIRGKVKQGKYLVYIYPVNVPSYHSLILAQKVLLFLKKDAIISGGPMFMNTPITHSVVPVSPSLNISKLEGFSEKEQIYFILNDYLRFKEDELSKIRKDISEIKGLRRRKF